MWEIESRYSKQCGLVHHSTVSRALTYLTKANFLKPYEGLKRPGRLKKSNERENSPGPTSNYTKKDNDIILTNLVCKRAPRARIYKYLRESDVLLEYLKFCRYQGMMRCKYGRMNELIKAKKTKGPMTEEMIAQFKSRHLRGQNFLLQKSDEEIMLMATRMAKFDLSQKNWETDSLYTMFFVTGGRYYSIIEESNR